MNAQTASPATLPAVRTITRADVMYALNAGLADLAAAPIYSLFFGAVFSVTGVVIMIMLFVQGSSYWVLPLAAGFPLIGPFAAVGLYEISRRREAGLELSWPVVLGAVMREGKTQIPSYAFVVLFVYLIWVYLAHLVFALTFGLKPLTNVMTSFDLLLSSSGIAMLVAGTLIGGAVSVFLFCISVITVPMLMDREIDIVSAMVTSVRAVIASPQPMLFWGILLAVVMAVAMVPLFLGVILAFPVLGHASWHLYRRVMITD
ncbi:MAG: DUF2189 domain-containing protein [Pseudomonadota bacterium]